jgi:ApaG protein
MTANEKHQIQIDVRTVYLPGQSAPDDDRYVFAYTVTITNSGSVPARLVTRHWIITDANERTQEVRGRTGTERFQLGEGVVGEQPYLLPGSSFQYTSGTILETPVGTMKGSYQMIADDGTAFDAEIPSFTLSIPRTLH